MFWKKETVLTTIIGSDSSLRGDLQSKGTIRIDGVFDGTIQADWVIVGESGSIKGDIVSRGAAVGGKVEGSLRCSEAAEIMSRGQIHGDIFTPKLSIPEGAIFDGRSHMLNEGAVESSIVLPLIPLEK